MISRASSAAVVALAALVATSLGAPARAAQPEPAERSIEQVMADAEARFKAGELEEALRDFQEAHRRTGYVGVLYPIARCYEELDRLEEALAAYDELAGDESLPAEARGKAAGAARVLRDRLAVGRLVLQVSPFGVTVLVDGKEVGESPVDPLEVAPGTHRVDLRGPRGRKATREIEVRGGRTTTIAMELSGGSRPVMGRLVITVAPDGAEVTVDGTPVGTAPVSPMQVAVGPHRVAVSKVGFEATEQMVDVTGEAPATVRVELDALDESGGSSVGQWTVLGGGAALALGGAVALWLGEQDHQKITGAEGYQAGQVTGMTYDEARALESSGDDKKFAGWLLVGAGGVAIATSVVWMLVDDGGEEGEARVTPLVTAVPGGFGLGAQGTF